MEAGDPVLDLHLWNEHIPRASRRGAGWTWAAVFLTRLADSLADLAEHVAHDPRMAEVKAVRARIAFAPSKRLKLRRLALRLGFELPCREPAANRHLQDRGEDLWLWALAWAFNPGSLQNRRLLRARETLWMSSRRLVARYHPRASAACDRDG